MAISIEKRARIESLLKEGKLSKRAISRQEKVSRITVDKIENKILFPPQPKSPSNKPKYIRCKGCGGKLLDNVECVVCELLASQIKSYNTWMDDLLRPSISYPERLPERLRQKGHSNGKA